MPRALLFAVACLVPAALAGCAVVTSEYTPREYRVVTRAPLDFMFHCMLWATDSLGYTVRASDRVGAFLRVERYYLPSVTLQTRDVINASMIERSGGNTTVQVTAWTEATVRGNLFGPTTTSARVLADASFLAMHCAPGATVTTWSDTTRT